MLKLKEYTDSFHDNTYLYYCFEAMKELHKSLDWICFHEEDMDDDDIQVYERNYIISLTTMLSRKGLTLPGLINGEVAKSLDAGSSKAKEEYVKIKRMKNQEYSPNSCYVFPDFLIHESHSKEQDTWTKENQHIIIEAKTKHIGDEQPFYLDFFKLNFYLKELNFESAIYIIVRTSVSDIQKYLSKYETGVDYLSNEAFDNLFFFVQENLKSEPKIYKLIRELL